MPKHRHNNRNYRIIVKIRSLHHGRYVAKIIEIRMHAFLACYNLVGEFYFHEIEKDYTGPLSK